MTEYMEHGDYHHGPQPVRFMDGVDPMECMFHQPLCAKPEGWDRMTGRRQFEFVLNQVREKTEAMRRIADRVVDAYRMNPARVAAALDEQVDRSGNLLGWVRRAALADEPEAACKMCAPYGRPGLVYVPVTDDWERENWEPCPCCHEPAPATVDVRVADMTVGEWEHRALAILARSHSMPVARELADALCYASEDGKIPLFDAMVEQVPLPIPSAPDVAADVEEAP